MDKIIDLDKQFFVFLNSCGSEFYDPFWLIITKQLNWLPFFIIVLYFLQKKIGWKKTGIVFLFLAFIILCTDRLTELSKFTFQRLRPCNDTDINEIIRVVRRSHAFSFFSGHASNSSATMVFLFLILRKYYKYAFLVFVFPLVFAFSRIYLGLHFPTDILVGFAVGTTIGVLFYKLYKYTIIKYNL